MSGLNYLKLGSTLSNICNTTNLTTPLNATTPSKISGESPGIYPVPGHRHDLPKRIFKYIRIVIPNIRILFSVIIPILRDKKIKVTHNLFLAPLAVSQRAYVMVCCPSCLRASVCQVVRPSVHPYINFFFKHLLRNCFLDFDEISQKCSCHSPLQNFLKEFYSFKNSGCHSNKT